MIRNYFYPLLLYTDQKEANDGKSKHGEVLIGSRSDLVSQQVAIEDAPVGVLVARILKLGERRVLLACLFNPPFGSSFFMAQSALNSLLRNVLEYTSQVNSFFVYGDFNISNISLKDYSYSIPDNQYFIDLMVDNDLNQILDFPTAATGVLVLVFVSKDLEVTSCKLGGDQMNSLSNHYSILTEIKIQDFKSLYFRPGKQTAIFSYCNGNFDKPNAPTDEKPFSGLCWSIVNVLIEQ